MNTKPGYLPIRLFAEVLGIVALAELLVVVAGAPLVPRLAAWQAGLANAAALVVLAAPPVYWRCMQLLRLAAGPRPQLQSISKSAFVVCVA